MTEKFTELEHSPSVWLLDPSSLTTERLDSAYYSPKFLRDRNRLESLPFEIRDFRNVCSRLNCGSTPKLVEYAETGTPLIRTSNVRPNSYDDSEVQRVADMPIPPSGALAILPGDVLYTMSGSVGYSAVYPENGELASCSNTIARCRVRNSKEFDPYYIALFLNSSLGVTQSMRLVSGGVLGHVMPNPVKRLRLLLPSYVVQRAIGNKIRKAERLRQIAQANWTVARLDLERSIGIDLSPEHFSRFTTNDIQADDYQCCSIAPAIALANVESEIGAQYFHPRRIHARTIASKTGRWDSLSELAARVTRGHDSGAGFLGLDAIDSSTGIINFSLIRSEGEETGSSSFAAGDLLFSRLRPYLNKLAIWPAHRGNGRGSGELLVYRPKAIDPYYLLFIAKGPLGLNQVIDVTAGSTHPRVDAEVVDQIRIPRLNEEIEKRIGSHVRLAHEYWYEAQELLPKAKSDVEALIAGTLNEDRLLREGEEIARWLEANPLPKKK